MSNNRINVLLKPNLKRTIERVAMRKGQSGSGWLRTLAIDRLIADGEITAAELEGPGETIRRRPPKRTTGAGDGDFGLLVAELSDLTGITTDGPVGLILAAQVAEFGSFEALVLDAFSADDQTRILHAAVRALGRDRAREVFPDRVRLGGAQ